jgi:hypothetical protein
VSAVEAVHLPDETIPITFVQDMRITQGWVRFLSVFGFVFMGLMILLGAGMLLAGAVAKDLPAWFGIVYVGVGFLYLPPSLLLHRYASTTSAFLRERTLDSLGVALARQRSFWRFVGVSAAILVGLYGLAIVGAIGFGFYAALTRHPG